MNDTHPDIERVQIELLRQAGPQRRLMMAMELTDRVVRLSRRAIAKAHPHLNALEQGLFGIEVAYGKDLAERLRARLQNRPAA